MLSRAIKGPTILCHFRNCRNASYALNISPSELDTSAGMYSFAVGISSCCAQTHLRFRPPTSQPPEGRHGIQYGSLRSSVGQGPLQRGEEASNFMHAIHGGSCCHDATHARATRFPRFHICHRSIQLQTMQCGFCLDATSLICVSSICVSEHNLCPVQTAQ